MRHIVDLEDTEVECPYCEDHFPITDAVNTIRDLCPGCGMRICISIEISAECWKADDSDNA